jgi:hypothetical protein
MEVNLSGEFIKAQLIQQTNDGKTFAVAYMDDGHYRLIVFDYNRVIVDFNVNEALKIDNNTIPINGFFQPFCVTAFMEKDELFYALYYKDTQT